MTDDNTPPAAPSAADLLWSNYRLGSLWHTFKLKRPIEIGWFDYDGITFALRRVRDDYEADRRRLQARIDELEAENRELSRMVSLEFEQAMKKGNND